MGLYKYINTHFKGHATKMSTENLAPYSPTTVYGQLTSPFTPKTISINAHTPFDKVDKTESGAFSREFFEIKPQTKLIYTELSNNYLYEVENEELEFYKNTNVSNFSVSEFSKDKYLNGTLNSGYSPKETATINKVNEAYKKSALFAKNGTDILSKCSYKVL